MSLENSAKHFSNWMTLGKITLSLSTAGVREAPLYNFLHIFDNKKILHLDLSETF